MNAILANWRARSRVIDARVVAVWLGLVFLGQCVLNREVVALEWLAVFWMCAGVLLVRRTSCLPFVIITCPVFMCEIHRAWAWSQPVMLALLLVRVLCENRFSKKQYSCILAVGVFVMVASLPQNAMDLIRSLQKYSVSELLRQWRAPEAVWAMFPFRQTADRTLVAALCCGMVLGGRYISSNRIWGTFWACAAMACAATLASGVLPWQEPHRFLGTTNYATFSGRPFHGPGFNVSFFTIVIALGLPWFFIRASRFGRPWLFGLAALCVPALLWPGAMINQKAFELFLLVLLVLVLIHFTVTLLNGRMRRRAVRRLRAIRVGRMAALVFVVCMGISGVWFLRMGILDPGSVLRVALAQRSCLWQRRAPLSECSAATGAGQAGRTGTEVDLRADAAAGSVRTDSTGGSTTSRMERVANILSKYDKVRGPMWALGARAIYRTYLLRGAGAGTWARYHRAQPRPRRQYFAHMHNTYLDVAFEYGMLATGVVAVLCIVAVGRLLYGIGPYSRVWILYLVSIGVMSLGQHFLYAFSTTLLLLPAFILIPRVLLTKPQGDDDT